MAERELAILLRAKDMASRTIKGVRGELGKMGGASGVGSRAIAGLTTNMVRLGAVVGVGLAGALGLGVRSLSHLARVNEQTNAVLESTGGIAGVTKQQVRDLAEEIENLTTADDKNVQEAENLLLTFTKIGKDAFPEATKAAVNMAIAMAKGDVANADFKGSALQVGKALNDPIKGMTALTRAGVSFTQEQKDRVKALVKAGKVHEAQAVILRELEVEFGKAGAAAGKGPEAAFRRLEDAGEDLSQALARTVLPVLERAAAWLTKKLKDPATIAFMEDLGEELGNAADAALRFVEGIDWSAIATGVGNAASIAKSVVGMFMGLPDWVKTAVITGWGLNKLTGGAVQGVIGSLASGLIKGVLGMNAGVVNINAAVVNGGGIGAPAAAAGAAAAGTGLALATAVIAPASVAAVGLMIQGKIDEQGAALTSAANSFAASASNKDLANAIAGTEKQLNDMVFNTFDSKNKVVGALNVLIAEQNRRAVEAQHYQGAAQRADAQAEARIASDAAGRQAAQASALLGSTKTLDAHTLSGLSGVINQVNAGKNAQVSASGAVAAAARGAGQLSAAAIRNKDLSVTFAPKIVTNVSVKETIHSQTTYKKYQKYQS